MSCIVYWNIDECAPYIDRMKIRGWCVSSVGRIVRVEVLFIDTNEVIPIISYGLSSEDVASNLKIEASSARFEEWIPLSEENRGRDFSLVCHLDNNEIVKTGSAHSKCREGDAGHRCWYDYLNMLGAYAPGNVLEIGSRARSGITRKELVPKQHNYFGLDINEGPNVDIVGDAHNLTRLFGEKKFVGVFSLAVFEHLAMPWKVVLEINKILEPNGIVFVSCQQTWPVHEEPCDYWRYTKYAWKWLFNKSTGFEVLGVVHGEPARIHPIWDSPVVRDMHLSTGYLNSSVIARKVGDTKLEWNVSPDDISKDAYTKNNTVVEGL